MDAPALIKQLEFRLSGGEININPFLSLGGQMSNAIPNALVVDGVFDNVWDDITVQERLAGETSYRWIYFYNNSLETIFNLKMYFLQIDSFVGATFNKNGPMSQATLLADEYTAPSIQEVGSPTDLVPAFTGITDSFDTTKESITILGPLQWIAICLRRVIPAGTDSHLQAQYKLIIESRS
jgi:hypothetical protein